MTAFAALLLGTAALAGAEGRADAYAAMRDAACDRDCRKAAVETLSEAALAGDRVALVLLADASARALPGAIAAADLVALEKKLAAGGDAVAAFRLVRRDESGESVFTGDKEKISVLTVAASDAGYVKSADAAWRLCALFGRSDAPAGDVELAERWCGTAAERGHAAAAIVVARLAPPRR